jgi:hypothetical protein
MLDMDDIQCREVREKSLHQAGVGTCALAWQVGFFFDGMLRNINQDSDIHRLSNVSRLFRAYPLQESMDLDSSYLYSAIYISGLGTPYEDQTADRLHSVMDSQQKALLDNSLESTSGQAKEAAVDALYDANKKDWFDTLSHNLKDLFSIKAAKAVITDTVQGIAKKVTLEALPALRDHPMVMEQFMTGVDARVDGAKNSFKEQISSLKAKNQLPIKLIQISVFGADLGGILARRFIEELLEEVCSKEGDEYSYEGAKVEITFAGLFDCSRRSSHDSGDTMADAFSLAGLLARPLAGPLEWIGGGKVIDFNKPLHPAVKKALHLVAAHERRVYRPLVPLGPLKSAWREELLPGVSEDITGGLLPNEQRPSAELCRVALHQMYNVARSGEVPFPNFKDLQDISDKVAAYFVMHDNLAGKSVRFYSRKYMQTVGGNKPSRQAFERHQHIYVWWLGRQYADYKARLKNASSEERSWLRERWGWLEFVRDEARYVERAVNNPNGYVAYAQGSNAFKMAKTFLYPPLSEFPEEVATFFAYFMHDFVSSTAFTTSPSEQAKIKDQSETMISSHHFFLARGIEAIDEVVADSNENRWKIPPRGMGTPVDIRTGLIEKKVDTVSYVPIGNALSKINNGFMSGVLLDGAMLSGDKCMFSIAENTLNDASKFYSLELTNQRERVNAGARKYAEYAYWAPQGGFVDIPVHPRNGEPNYVFTPDFSGCCLVVDKINDTTLRVRHVEGGKEEVQYNTLQASEIGNGMVGHMLYDDYGIINGSENRCGFAFMVYSGGRWVIKWQANVGTMKLVKKKATGLFSKTECETALVTIAPKIFATGSRAIEV